MKKNMWKSKAIILFIITFVVTVLCNIDQPIAQASNIERDILRFNIKYPEDDELANLPKSCTAKIMDMKYKRHEITITPKTASIVKAYKKRVGNTRWTYLHHYCAGLMRFQRYARSKQAGIGMIDGLTRLQKMTLQSVIGEFKYAKSHYEGYPEYIIAMKLTATAFWELGNYSEAFKTLKKGIRSDPKYPTLYIQLANYLITLGKVGQAKKVLQKGIKSTGNNKKIRDMLSGIK